MYCAHLYPLLEDKITSLTSRIEATPRSLQIREFGNRWGSCSQKGDLYFHWRVAMLPRAIMEYAVVHDEYGLGLVVAVDEPTQLLVIEFDDSGEKFITECFEKEITEFRGTYLM